MDTIREQLKRRNIKITSQRLCVFKSLTEADDEKKHLTVEELYTQVRKRCPAISLATVYSILEQFKKTGLVKELKINFNKSVFESRTDGHHHFMCLKCNTIYDIDIQPCATLTNKNIFGHTIKEFHGYFYGVCKKCNG